MTEVDRPFEYPEHTAVLERHGYRVMMAIGPEDGPERERLFCFVAIGSDDADLAFVPTTGSAREAEGWALLQMESELEDGTFVNTTTFPASVVSDQIEHHRLVLKRGDPIAQLIDAHHEALGRRMDERVLRSTPSSELESLMRQRDRITEGCVEMPPDSFIRTTVGRLMVGVVRKKIAAKLQGSAKPTRF